MTMTLKINKGIERNVSTVNSSGDISFDELTGIRKYYGQWEILGDKKKLYEFSDTALPGYISGIWYYHSMADEKYVLVAKGYEVLQVDISAGTKTTIFTSPTHITSIYAFNDIVIVNTVTKRTLLKYDKDTNTYDVLPQFEDIPFAICSSSTSPKQINIERDASIHSWDDILTMANDMIVGYQDEGYFNGNVVVMGAFKTIEGDYIYYTQPFYYYIGQHDFSSATDYPYIKYDSSANKVYLNLYYYTRLVVKFFDTTKITTILNEYSKYLVSFDMFMTLPFGMITTANGYYQHDSSTTTTNISISYSSTEILARMLNMYLLKSYKSGDLTSTTVDDEVNANINDLKYQPVLQVNQNTNHTLISDNYYNFNLRLHLYNLRTLLPEIQLQPVEDYQLVSHEKTQCAGEVDVSGTYQQLVRNGSSGSDKLILLIRTLDNKNIIREYSNVPLFNTSTPSNDYVLFNPFMGYNGMEVKWIKFYKYDSSAGKYYLTNGGELLNLYKHPYINMRYRFGKDKFNNYSWDLWSNYQILFDNHTDLGSSFPYTEDRLVYDTNRIQVSEVNQPIYYQLKHSYRIGDDSNVITALATQSIPLTEYNFGEYNLYAFTNEGVFALKQGSGDILYGSIQNISLDVALSKNQVVPVNKGVIFSTDKGLRILSGRDNPAVSTTIQGAPKTLNETYFNNMINGTDLVLNTPDICSKSDFIDYLDGATILYDNTREELIIHNNDLYNDPTNPEKYSYIFSVRENTWTKTTLFVDNIILNTNKFLKYYGSKYYVHSITEEESAKQNILLKTNPIKFDTFKLKKITGIAPRYKISNGTGMTDDSHIAFYLYGSLDGINWVFINGVKALINTSTGSDNHLLLRRIRTTARYFMFVLAGYSNVFNLDSFDLDLKLKYDGKVRP